jgi:membrane protease YdiL (CAAX protease family)
MHRTTLLIFGSAVLVVCALIWSAEALFPESLASAVVLVSIVVLSLLFTRPGWGLKPKRFEGYWLVLFGVILISSAGAAWFALFFQVPLPYDLSKLNLIAAIPAILAITGLEELLFRQIMYRWLEHRQVSGKIAVVATSVAFGWAHLGPIFIGSPIGPTFYLLTSGLMVWIGILLGEIRRAAGSWLLPWLGHFGYNVTILLFLLVFNFKS